MSDAAPWEDYAAPAAAKPAANDTGPWNDFAPAKPADRVGWAEENLAGPSEVIGSTIANLPHGAASAAVNIYRRLTGGDTDAPDPKAVQAIGVPLGAGGTQLLGDLKAMIPARSTDNQPDDTNIPQFGDTTQNILGHTVAVAGDVANLTPLAAAGGSVVRRLAAPAEEISSTQQLLNDHAAAAPQSMGAAASAPDISGASAPLQAEIHAGLSSGKAPNMDALARQVKADEFGIQMTKGEATQDSAQLANEFNSRNQNPEFAARKADTNQKLIDGVNSLKEDAGASSAAVDNEANAQTVIDAYKAKYAPIAADARAKWEAFQQAAGGQLPLDTGDLTDKAAEALKKVGKTRYLPAEVAGDLSDIKDGEPFTVERWDNLKTNLAQAQRTAEKSGNGNAGLAVKAVRDAVENYDFPNLDPKLKALNDQARQATAAKYAILKADPAMDAAVNDGVKAGQLSPEAQGYMEKYFLKGDKASLAKAQENLADNPDAKGAVTGTVLNALKKNAGIDLYRDSGNFSQAGYNKTLNEMQGRIPYLMDKDVADKAFRLGDVARDTQFQPKGAAFNNSGTSVVAGAAKHIGSLVAHGAETAGNLIPGLKLGTGVREALEKRANAKWVADSLKPGAGINP